MLAYLGVCADFVAVIKDHVKRAGHVIGPAAGAGGASSDVTATLDKVGGSACICKQPARVATAVSRARVWNTV